MYLVPSRTCWLPFPHPCYQCGTPLEALFDRDADGPFTRYWHVQCPACSISFLLSVIRPPDAEPMPGE